MPSLSSRDILRCISDNFETMVMPALSGDPAASPAQTISHLLRHVIVRLDTEHALRVREIDGLEALLAEVREYLARLDASAPAGSPAQNTLAELSQLAMPDTHSLNCRAYDLRKMLYESLRTLQSLRGREGATPAYQAIRGRLREYMRRDVEEEALLVEPAFAGKGPRR